MTKIVEAKNAFVLILRDPDPVKSGSILLPDQAKKKPDRGTVISVGKGKYEDGRVWCPSDDLKPGDRVLFQPYAVAPVQLDLDGKGKKEYIFLPYYAILAVIED